MKVIDLLNKIANGEEVPKKIKYREQIYEYEEGYDFACDNLEHRYFAENYCNDYEDLNSEVEIIEEDKKIEKVNNYVLCDYDFKNKDDDNNLIATNIIDKAFEEYSHKINEIIDKLNEMENE